MRVRIKAAGQVGEVTIHGWDPKTKREIVGKAKAEGETGEGSKKHGGNATLAFAGDEHMPADVATAEAMAKGRMRKLAESFVTAQVEMIGHSGVQPGALVNFEKMGEQLDGKYRVEKARHAFGKHGQTKPATEAQDRPDNGRGLTVGIDRPDKGTVDLDLVERKCAQVRERRIAGAEIVHRDTNTERLDLPQGRQRAVEIANKRGFGDLNLQATG